MTAQKINVKTVNFARLDGFHAGEKGEVHCDVSNDPLTLGEEVQVLAAVDADGTLWVTHVCRADLDLDPTPEELDDGKVTLRATLIEADRFPGHLVLGGTKLPGDSE